MKDIIKNIIIATIVSVVLWTLIDWVYAVPFSLSNLLVKICMCAIVSYVCHTPFIINYIKDKNK